MTSLADALKAALVLKEHRATKTGARQNKMPLDKTYQDNKLVKKNENKTSC